MLSPWTRTRLDIKVLNQLLRAPNILGLGKGVLLGFSGSAQNEKKKGQSTSRLFFAYEVWSQQDCKMVQGKI
jgi:hypothetical protein